jgi:hypothetical protein
MMKKIIVLTSVFFCMSAYTQGIQFSEINSNFSQEKVERFEFIDKNLNLTNHERIAVLNGYSVNSEINLFNAFWKVANNFGANSYFIDKVESISDTIFVQISVYYLDKTTIDENFKLYPQNMVYIFGDLDAKKGKTRKIKLNGASVELAPFEYIEHQNEVGQRTTISIGGFTGTKAEIRGREGRLPTHYSLSGFRVGPSFSPSFYPNQGVGISFSTGGIHNVQINFGQFLINILTKKE